MAEQTARTDLERRFEQQPPLAAQTDRHRANLERQLEMNPKSWAELCSRGVDEQTSLRVDFVFQAPGEAQARALERFLRENSSFGIEARPLRRRLLTRRRWLVIGSAEPVTLTLETLNRLVIWLIGAGVRNGPCDFAGWGARIPQADPASDGAGPARNG